MARRGDGCENDEREKGVPVRSIPVLKLRGGCKDGISSDEEACMGGAGSQTDDDEPSLLYMSEEGVDINTSAREVVQSILENILAEGEKVIERDNQANEECEEANSGATFLQQLDRDYLCSPRMIVRGVYVGDVLKLIVKRKTEGTYVDWTIFNMKTKKLVLNVKGEMTYPYALSRKAQGTKFGSKVMGGWRWRGYGYGFINLFPSLHQLDPTKILHVDIDEAIFFEESIFQHYHLSGLNCMNVNGAENINCKEKGCGVRIWSIMFTTYTTVEEVVEDYQPKKRRKEREVEEVYLSLVAFFSGDFKIVLHRYGRLQKYLEEVAWLSKDESAEFSDSLAAVDRLKIDKARMIWETNVPKLCTEGDNLAAQVDAL